MALIRLIERVSNPYRAEFLNGYYRINSVNLDKNLNKVSIRVLSYADEAARRYKPEAPAVSEPIHPAPPMSPEQNGQYITDEYFDFTFKQYNDAATPTFVGSASDVELTIAYRLLKTLPKFKDAKDC